MFASFFAALISLFHISGVAAGAPSERVHAFGASGEVSTAVPARGRSHGIRVMGASGEVST